MFLYITYADLKGRGFHGIYKKVLDQMKAFEKTFGVSYYTYWHKKTAFLMCGFEVLEEKMAFTRREYRDVLIGWIKKHNITCTYIRYPFADKAFLDLLKTQKKMNIKSVVEIPTYPYDEQLKEGRFKEEDRYFRKRMVDDIGAIATYSLDSTIWGVRCIPLLNGIEVGEISVKKQSYAPKKLVFIAVASMAYWHGYERLIRGMYEYYQMGGDWTITLDLVGEGDAIADYKSICDEYQLQKYVRFHGQLDGEELNRCFNQADVAVSSLCLYKIGLTYSSPIKDAEYCARGIPIVVGYESLGLPDDLSFVLRVPNDSTPINIQNVIEFYENFVSQENYQEQIRDYAESHFSWDNILKPVVEYLQH